MRSHKLFHWPGWDHCKCRFTPLSDLITFKRVKKISSRLLELKIFQKKQCTNVHVQIPYFISLYIFCKLFPWILLYQGLNILQGIVRNTGELFNGFMVSESCKWWWQPLICILDKKTLKVENFAQEKILASNRYFWKWNLLRSLSLTGERVNLALWKALIKAIKVHSLTLLP